MADVLNLEGKRALSALSHGEPDGEAITRLEELLAEARSGHLRSVAYVAIDIDRGIMTGWDGRCDRHDLIAGTGMLQHHVLRHHFDEIDE